MTDDMFEMGGEQGAANLSSGRDLASSDWCIPPNVRQTGTAMVVPEPSRDVSRDRDVFAVDGLRGTPLLQQSAAKQEAVKQKFMVMVNNGSSQWDAMHVLGINYITMGAWQEDDPRIAAASQKWERGLALQYEQRFQDIFWNPAKYDKALSRPMWFNFAIARLKALDPRYKDGTQVNVDARSVIVGESGLAGMVASGRDNKQIIEGLKKELTASRRG